jgi:hypothetical protein
VRVQLRIVAFACLLVAWLAPAAVRAQVAQVDTTHGLYYESPTRTNMTVYTPAGQIQVSPTGWLTVRAGWEADIVSGASVKQKAGSAYKNTHPAADVITTASVKDLRNTGRGGFTLKKDNVSLTGGYAYSTENDYRSHSFNVTARTDQFEHNTQFELAYSRNFDQVCDRVQGASETSPTRWVALETSRGCFASDPLRTARDIDIDGFQGTWSQAWTPIFTTQLAYSAEILHGFQSNPYRTVIIGEGIAAQEHHPENRGREAVTARANIYLRPLKAALRLTVRGYWDTWDVKSGTGEAEFEKHLGEQLRVTARGRYYKQTGALFWSDDYTGGDPPLGPKGQYWTGDRELSPFSSILAGLRAFYTIAPQEGRVLGLMTSLKVGASADVLFFHYDEYTLGGTPLSNTRAYLGTLSLSAAF